MKKIFAAFLCAVLLFGGCAKNGGKERLPDGERYDPEKNVGEGLQTFINILVRSNIYLVEDVFVASRLPTDASAVLSNEDGVFAPVVSETITSYAKLKETLLEIYLPETVEAILNEPKQYVEIDGKLYFNMKYDKKPPYSVDWSDYSTRSERSGDDYEITIESADGKKFNVRAVKVGLTLKLDKMFS